MEMYDEMQVVLSNDQPAGDYATTGPKIQDDMDLGDDDYEGFDIQVLNAVFGYLVENEKEARMFVARGEDPMSPDGIHNLNKVAWI
uniref:Uncharacterized protein n=1 Tax=Nelumbo nucifera TaxID=4432 RepID=A0A822XFF3_NELNU|nr:TPA_asm: hypothetical protein HUJ06_019209 [Nelumbo nucifera]